MSKWIYEYEDHTYKNQKRPNEIMPEIICKPGKHNWFIYYPKFGREVCRIFGLMRWAK